MYIGLYNFYTIGNYLPKRFAYLELHYIKKNCLYRLRMMNEETSVQQMPRRRSNSLPIPKIEVSIYQSPESKKKDVSKDFMEVPEVRDVTLLTGTWKYFLAFF